MSYVFVTTFSDAQRDLYAQDMLDSFIRHANGLPGVVLLPFRDADLCAQEDYLAFLDQYGNEFYANGVLNPDKTKQTQIADYRYQATRFCHKVFAYTNPTLTENMTDDDWLIWLDADTKMTGDVTQEWLEAVCPGGYMGSYIGRQRPDWDHSECGWIAFSMRYHGREFLEKMRLFYTSGLIFGLDQWHDSYVWDRVRQSMELKYGSRWFDLAKGIPGSHPWPDTKLGEIIEHYKGPAAKKERFGAVG